MSSELPSRGRKLEARLILETAYRVGQRAIDRVASDTLESYLSNLERQEAIERLLIRFGEALKALPDKYLEKVDATFHWHKPMRFRDLAAHWYAEGLDHELIWNVLRHDLPPMLVAIRKFLASPE